MDRRICQLTTEAPDDLSCSRIPFAHQNWSIVIHVALVERVANNFKRRYRFFSSEVLRYAIFKLQVCVRVKAKCIRRNVHFCA